MSKAPLFFAKQALAQAIKPTVAASISIMPPVAATLSVGASSPCQMNLGPLVKIPSH